LLAPGVRVSFVVQSEEAPYRYVSVEAAVTSVAPSPGEAQERRLAHRYLGWLSVDYRRAFP